MAASKIKKPVAYVTGDGPLAEIAAAVATAIMRTEKARYWSQVGPLDGKYALTPHQQYAVEQCANMLSYLRGADPDQGRERIAVAVCPSCHKWLLVGSRSAPTKCSLTMGCPGKPRKVVAARIQRPDAAG
jgi:hypothetical protein